MEILWEFFGGVMHFGEGVGVSIPTVDARVEIPMPRKSSSFRELEAPWINRRFMGNRGLRGKREIHQPRADIVLAVASIPITFMLRIREKRSEAGKALGCSV